jgi:hypothetical protein
MLTTFEPSPGEIYQIEIVDDGNRINVSRSGKVIGHIGLDERWPDYGPQLHYFHICELSLEACKRRGVGKRCLELHKKTFNSPITAAGVNDPEQDDGSQLIGDGGLFIQKMRAHGLVLP